MYLKKEETDLCFLRVRRVVSRHIPNFAIMPRTSEKRYMPCHVAGCKFLTTSNGGLKNHLRTHAPGLRAGRRKEQARRERETRQNADNSGFDDNFNPNLHEDDNVNGVENDDDDDNDNEDEAEERRNPSMPQRNANRSVPEDIQYHPIINGACMLLVSRSNDTIQSFSRPPL